MPDERLIYGCIGADRPEAQPYIEEVDGVLYYTCPECRQELGELGSPLRSQPDPPRTHVQRPARSKEK